MDNLVLKRMKKRMIKECVDLFIDTFSKEPWNDVYDSREKIVRFFRNHIKNNYFLGYVAKQDKKIVALSVGMKKPWVEGVEYYVDEFCVSYELQGKGIGTWFMKAIEEDTKKLGLNGFFLNTERGYPAQKFYERNGFKILRNTIVMGK
jgi:GNAT superfamily N-acetyltransferase